MSSLADFELDLTWSNHPGDGCVLRDSPVQVGRFCSSQLFYKAMIQGRASQLRLLYFPIGYSVKSVFPLAIPWPHYSSDVSLEHLALVLTTAEAWTPFAHTFLPLFFVFKYVQNGWGWVGRGGVGGSVISLSTMCTFPALYYSHKANFMSCMLGFLFSDLLFSIPQLFY